jgi:cytochrome c peroxidase
MFRNVTTAQTVATRAAAALLITLACTRYGAARGGDSIASDPRTPVKQKYVRPSVPLFPADNGFTAEREYLGKSLFFDPRLSGSKFISCATCHNPGLAWGDGLSKGIGDGKKPLGRHTPTILNVAYGDLMFWDGRADSLEAQALGPIQSAAEMNLPLDQAIQRLSAIPGYKTLFAKAYPGEPICDKTIAKAIATFERTVVSSDAPFDRWIAGDSQVISAQAKQGFDLFNGKAGCAQCHSGWNFTDGGFHDIGLADADLGRGALLKLDAMQHAFKTPTLRNAAVRAPYMHDGSESSLEAVIDFYDSGSQTLRSSVSPEIRPLHLSAQEKSALISFIQTLTSPDKTVFIPALPR